MVRPLPLLFLFFALERTTKLAVVASARQRTKGRFVTGGHVAPKNDLPGPNRRQMPIFLSWLNETAGGSVTIARWPDAIMRDPCMRNRECYEIGKAPLRYSLPWVEQ
ncbi:hypothetical protein D7U70_12670 [Pseudomonas balearica]|nr:hypothetical protein [Stutzerimonas balearica]